VQDPPEDEKPAAGVDPNEKSYPLPTSPDSLRLWVLEWSPLDTEVPAEGVWSVIEEEKVDLGDADENWLAWPGTHDGSLEDLVHDIEGDAAWDLLPVDAVAQDQMTSQQEAVEAAREGRTDLQDKARMERRRKKLADRFVAKYEMDPARLEPFMQWAGVMKEGWDRFESLCQ
jgi:hypothetical protein